MLGGKRVGNRGGATCDVDHAWLAVEVKHRKTLPTWLVAALKQARVNSDCVTKLPIVVLHESGQRHANDLVVLRLADFVEFFGDVPVTEVEVVPVEVE